MDRLAMQAAMSGNLEAQRRVFGVSRKEKDVKPVDAPAAGPRKSGELPVALQAILGVDQQINAMEFDRRMAAATQKELAKSEKLD